MHRISGRNDKASTENENRREGVKGKNPDHGTDSSVERFGLFKKLGFTKKHYVSNALRNNTQAGKHKIFKFSQSILGQSAINTCQTRPAYVNTNLIISMNSNNRKKLKC